MKHLDKENIIVIGIALLLLIGWGVWYPKHQAERNLKIQEQRAVAQAMENKNLTAQNYASRQIARKQSVSPGSPVKTAPVLPKHPPIVLSNDLTSFVIDPDSGSIDKIELLKYDTSDRTGHIVYDSEKVPRKTFSIDGLENWQTVSLSVIQQKSVDNSANFC